MRLPSPHIVPCILLGVAISGGAPRGLAEDAAAAPAGPQLGAFVETHCLACHDRGTKKAELDLESLDAGAPGATPQVWEKVLRRLAGRQMPPPGRPRPSEAEYDAVSAALAAELDRAASGRPDPGRTDALRRLNRTEYGNAIRDLLALEVDAAELLPADEPGHGFDNVAVVDLSPTRIDRYLAAAERISRLAVGADPLAPEGRTVRLRADLTQEKRVEGLPVGTRGGALVRHIFPRDGDYEVRVRLTRDRNEEVEGLTEPHDLELLLDRERVTLFSVRPPAGADHSRVDAHLASRFSVPAGPHEVGVTFLARSGSLLETRRQPYNARYNMHRHPRVSPAVYEVSITGPFASSGAGDTPSRRRIFARRPAGPGDEEACAREIIAGLARRAYRRPVTAEDLERPLAFYREARAGGGFDDGIELALRAILVAPEFLFRIERDAPGLPPGAVYPVSGVELASRLSFFLWSSIPDDALLDAAERGELDGPEGIERQARRMLADPRARNLAVNFAAQWLHLPKLESITPDLRLFPDFDDNLRRSFRRETELLFEAVLREDRSLLDLLRADFTFLDERLAKHYGVPHVYGSRFRRVALGAERERGGLLRQGSVLTVTSYPTRTSPVIRGHWVLANLLSMPPPPPPPGVPALEDKTVSASLPIRERLAEHRSNAACSGCHRLMDPVGFALENFDAVGRWRTQDAGVAIDAAGSLPSGEAFSGAGGLEEYLLRRPEVFAGAVAEKLLTFALGRGVETFDASAIRRIVREARRDGFRLSSMVVAVAKSVPFRMRRTAAQ
jgi:mono/diheme cytochrome c family protein